MVWGWTMEDLKARLRDLDLGAPNLQANEAKETTHITHRVAKVPSKTPKYQREDKEEETAKDTQGEDPEREEKAGESKICYSI